MEKRLEKLLKQEYETVDMVYRQDYGHPFQRFIFKGILLSPYFTKYVADGNEAIYLGPKGQLLHYHIHPISDIGGHTIYPDFKSFQEQLYIDEALLLEVSYEVGSEREEEIIFLCI